MPDYGPPAPVPVFQHAAEFARLLDIYRERKPKRVLEVGTYHGGTLYHWLQNAQPGTTVVTVDLGSPVDNSHLYPEWVPKGVELVVIHGDSHDLETIQKAMEHAPYDWLFIDADHYYESVKADWEAYGPMVSDGGVVVFHDIYSDPSAHPEIEVNRLWREIQAAGNQTAEIVLDPPHVWSGLGVVYL